MTQKGPLALGLEYGKLYLIAMHHFLASGILRPMWKKRQQAMAIAVRIVPFKNEGSKRAPRPMKCVH